MSDKEKSKLGKGIRALLNNIDQEEQQDKQAVVSTLSNLIAMLPLEQIEVNPYQPRVEFEEVALRELAESLKVHGLVQPITVRRLDNSSYQLISGERRLRAAKLAGLEEVPAYIRLANDQEMLEMALIENIQREQLNAIEVAITYKRLMDECNITHEEVAKRVSKERSTITNSLRLLKLPPDIQVGLKKGLIMMGHARALVGVDDLALQLSLYRETLDKGLTVRKLEELIRSYTQPQEKTVAPKTPHIGAEYKKVQDNLSHFFGTKVVLKKGEDGKGQIVVNFKDDKDLNRILDLLEEE
jgi:ParB family chromosome partitioning protein